MAQSTFPLNIDSFKIITDYPASKASAVAEFQTLKSKTSLTSAEQSRLNELLIELDPYMIKPSDWEQVTSAITNVETHYKNNVDGYIQTKQAEFNATLAKFSYKGLYDSNTTYQQWNVVTYNYETYLSKQDNNLNHTPVGDVNDLWWAKIAQRGGQGIPGIGLSWAGNYNSSVTYTVGQAVNYNNSIYYCIADNVGHLPTETAYWQVFLSNSGITIQNTAPTNPYVNQVWVDTSTSENLMKYWDGSIWKLICNADALAAHQADDMPHKFIDITSGKTYKYGLKQQDNHMVFVYQEVV